MSGNMIEEATEWALQLKLPLHLREATIVKLWQRYKDETDSSFLKKMCRSKTGINDKEREIHEQIARAYPDWLYEFNTPYGSADFVDVENRTIYEVKVIDSWKQSTSVLLHQLAMPSSDTWQPSVILFGKRIHDERLRRLVSGALKALGINTYYWDGEYAYSGILIHDASEMPRVSWNSLFDSDKG